MIRLCVFAILLSLCACTDARKKDDINTAAAISPKAPLNDRNLINGLLRRATDSGDAKAYNEVASYYLIERQGEEFLYYALRMANKYNNAEACYHVYDILVYPRTAGRLKDLDNRSRDMALFYLLKSYEIGFESATSEVKEVFKNKPVPKSSEYLVRLSNDQ